jgi:magnesium transporter
MSLSVLQDEVRDLIKARQFPSLREALKNREPHEVIDVISDLPVGDQAIIFRLLPRELAAEFFELLELERQKDLLRAMGQEEVVNILNEMSPDDRTALLEELPGSAAKQLMELLSPEERAVARSLMGYPEGSIGRLMTPDYIAISTEWTVSEVLTHIRENGRDSETLNVIYVTDPRGKLLDDMRVREFLLAPLDSSVSELMDGSYVTLAAADDRETAGEMFRKYDRVALPVIDTQGYLIGIVTVDDVLDVIEEEHTEDVLKFGGVEVLEYPYTATPVFEMIRRRASWLVILFLGEMLTATAMGYFEKEIAKAVVLALFVPLIISSGGNSGSQAATLIIRAMALGELTLKGWWFVMRREIVSGIALGGILGVIGFSRIAIWSAFSDIYGPHWMPVAFTVACSLLGVVLWGTLTGSMLPFLLRRLGFDPAASSAPFVATLVDVTGLVIYFSFAALILRGTLL